MEENKISILEIEELRQKAEEERRVRRAIQAEIELARLGHPITEKSQMTTLLRGQDKEIVSMLEAYKEGNKQQHGFTLCDSAQMYLYQNRYKSDSLRKAWLVLLKNLPLCYQLEVKIVQNASYYPETKLSAKAECLLLEDRLNDKRCQESISGNSFFDVHFKAIRVYFEKFDLDQTSECYLMREFLSVKSGREQFIENCRQVVSDYIRQKKRLSLDAERILIASGDHELIMQYIQTAVLRSEAALLERGNREEVTAYFEHYATL